MEELPNFPIILEERVSAAIIKVHYLVSNAGCSNFQRISEENLFNIDL